MEISLLLKSMKPTSKPFKTDEQKSQEKPSITKIREFRVPDKDKNVTNRMTQDNIITEFIRTEDWTPISIHSSHIIGDLLVGMVKENINGDICASESYMGAVVVVKKSGQYRFSYTGLKSALIPFDVCTDILDHTMVCDALSQSVHLLHENGLFLSLLLTQQENIAFPRSVLLMVKIIFMLVKVTISQ
ncbi:uncharacterized protein LOC133190729 [Saccostrea echinata]|uniref:uncharacterized protein LOC133190729 n=1 Tax=Saccostrea echinata TaxID=191078 RepID=UPI002A839FCC|nr:uncharacterized protein LOC133190729 [Saccostrea echinata]